MSRYNLIEEKWIPVRFPDGGRDEWGIQDTLLRSREIAEIEDPSPLVVAALHRFLLAVLYRALEGPTDIEQAKALFKNGLPGDKIAAYLKKWRDRFWLFDEKYPFYQVPDYEPKIKKGKQEWRTWPAIAAEHNADNAKVLFDHIEINNVEMIPSAKATRWLIACQSFVLGGGNSDFVYTKGAPSANAVMAIALGVNLQNTLLLNLVPENKSVWEADVPFWERKPEHVKSLENGKARAVAGFADLFTWQSRSVRFHLEGNGDTVRELVLASGVECSTEDSVDSMLGYRIDEKRGKLPIQFRERGLWRDFDSLLPDEMHLAPLVIEHAITLTRSIRERFPKSVMIYGQANNKAKIEYWRMERFALPEAIRGDHNIRREIRQLLTAAEEAQKSLWVACRTFARDILSRGERNPDAEDIKKFIAQLPTIPLYWSTLESRFHEILGEYSLERDSEDIRCGWLKSIRDTLRTTWNKHRASASVGDAWTIRAAVKGEATVLRKLNELDEEIAKLEPRKEVA